jgi:hypothetical protein
MTAKSFFDTAVKKFSVLKKSKPSRLQILTILLMVISLLATLFFIRQRQLITKRAVTGNASLNLPSQRSVEINQEFEIPVTINTDNQAIVGVDVIIQFDRQYLTLVNVTPYPDNSNLKFFLPQTNGLFNAQAVIIQANSDGKIQFGAVTFDWNSQVPLPAFSGILPDNKPLASLKFKAIKSGNTNIAFEFSPDATTDSNLAKETDAVDILAKVTNLSLNIASPPTVEPTPTSTTPVTPTPTPTSPMTPTPIPTSPVSSPADIDRDGDIDIFDYTILVEEFIANVGQPVIDNPADLDQDGDIDIFDYSIFVTLFIESLE